MKVLFTNFLTKYIKLLKFENPEMELAYQKDQKRLDSKLFTSLAFFFLLAALLNGAMAITFVMEEDRFPFYIANIVLPILGFLLKNRFPTISRLVILLTLPISISGFRDMLPFFWEKHLLEKSFAFGNLLGIIEAGVAMNIRSISYKNIFLLIQLVLKVSMNYYGYFEPPINLFGAIGASALVMLSSVYQEILNRQDYKVVYESQERLQQFQVLLSKDFPVGVVVISEDFSTILYLNQFFQDSFEEDLNKVKGSVFSLFELELNQLQNPDETKSSLLDFIETSRLQELVTNSKNHLVLSAIYRSSDEQDSHYELKIRKTTWDHHSAYAMIFNDVSEKQMITALKLADKEKDRVIATVSHELRTPINGTLGLLEMISQRITDDVSQSYLKYCTSCNKLLLYLVNSILDLSQITQNVFQIAKESFQLSDLSEELSSLYLYQCKQKNVSFKVEIDQTVPAEIYTDRFRFIEILINLVGNAIKFTFEGSITLKIRLDEDPKKLRVCVEDTGIGIQEKEKVKLFERFRKIPQKNSNINLHGVGLGLAIVQDLVKAINDGDVFEKPWFESEVGKGSKFYFRIPYLKKQQGTLSVKDLSFDSFQDQESFDFPIEDDRKTNDIVEEKLQKYDFPSLFADSIDKFPTLKKLSDHQYTQKVKSLTTKQLQNQKSVLIVDDNPFNILAATFVVEKLHFQVDKAFHGKECIELISKNAKEQKFYDFILMDIQMPIMDGPQASQMITNMVKSGELRYTPIVALTAKKSTQEEKEYYFSCGIEDILEKPLNAEELKKIIQRLVQ